MKEMKTKINSKIAVTTFLVLICVTTSQAQINVGIKVGFNESTQSDLGDIYDNQDLRPGLSLGGSALYRLTENMAATLEVNYIQKGKKVKSGNTNDDSNLNSNCDYLTVPLIIRSSTQINEKKTLGYLEAGPYYGYMINNKTVINEENVNEKKYYGNDLGLVFGVGIIQPIADLNIIIGLRYEMGLLKVSKQDDELRNKTLTLSVGYQF
jgi:hypothetical protein